MKGLYLKITICLFLIITLGQVMAQRSNGLAVEGKIIVQEGGVEGAIIQMYQDGRRLDNYGVSADGRYKVELNYNHKFELVFEMDNHFSQKIVVETAVPKNILQSDPRFPPFFVDINMFTEVPGIDKTFSQRTVLKIYYNPNVDNFVSELYYNNAQIKKLIDQAIVQSKMIGKEAGYLSKLTRAEIAELRREYNQILEQAGEEYSSEQFLAALDGFKAAGKIFPNEQFPKDRIAEINDLLGLIMAASELDNALAERFDALIYEADLLFNQTNFTDARNSYNRALSIRQGDNHAIGQVKKINDLLNEEQVETQYRDLIAQGDKSFREILYTEAIRKYQDAYQLKPDENYPKSKMDEINGILADLANNLKNQESYKQAMFQAESLFEKQFYDKSLASYQNALNYKPGDLLATRKIVEVKGIVKEITDRMQYDKLVKAADKSYKKKLYPEALSGYNEATVLFSNEPYPKNRIQEINEIMDLREDFADLIYKADNQFISQDYEASKLLYQQALNIQKNDTHSLVRVREIDGILVSQGKEVQYNILLAQADDLFSENSYENAKSKYTEALGIKPREKYPKDKISEINSILQHIVKTNQQYKQAVTKADGLFQQKIYEKSKIAFADAGLIKPEEVYPFQMIAKIDSVLAEQVRLAEEAAAAETARLAAVQEEKDKNYSGAITRADNFFDRTEYENACNEYRTALAVKPEEAYPQGRIDEIGTILAQLSAAQKAYEGAVSRGDLNFRSESFEAAKIAFNEAKVAKPDESYPDEMIVKIDSIVEARSRLVVEAAVEQARLAEEAAVAETARLAAVQAETDKNYSGAITRADNFFDRTEYENACNEYRTALSVKPKEAYPQGRIDEIGKILNELVLAREKQELQDRNYANLIQQADRFFTSSNYLQSKTKYVSALELKPDEKHPKERMLEIEEILQQQKLDEEYRSIILAADGFFKTESYLQAKEGYKKALTVKFDEQYPKSQISKIDVIQEKERQRILAEKQAAENFQRRSDEIAQMNSEIEARDVESETGLTNIYNQFISKADAFFNDKQYNVARAWYYQAWEIKPEETYPPQRIDEINRLIDGMLLSQRDRDYQQYVDLGDSTFRDNKLAIARGWYNQALGIKANEIYPQRQIVEIQQKIAERIAGQAGQQFETHVKKASKAFDAQGYNVARFWYKKALELRPNDEAIKARLLEIRNIFK